MTTWAEVQAGLEGLQEALRSSPSSPQNVGEVLVVLKTLGDAFFWGIPTPQLISDWVKRSPTDLLTQSFLEIKDGFSSLQEDDEDAKDDHFEYCSCVLQGFLSLHVPMVEPSPWASVLDLVYTMSTLDEGANFLYKELSGRP